MRKSVETFQLHQCNACTELDAAKAPVQEDVVNRQSSNHCHSKAAPSMPSESSGYEESFIQLKRNIDDDNAEAAEMARLEAQSDKDMGEDND